MTCTLPRPIQWTLRLLVVMALVSGVTSAPALAQWGPPFPNQQRPNQRQPNPRGQPPAAPGMAQAAPRVEATGTIDAIAGGALRILTPAGQPWQLIPARECQVTVTGKAKPDVVRPGQFVAFTAAVDTRTGKVAEPVNQLTLFTASREQQLGVFPESAMRDDDGKGGAAGGLGPNGLPGGMGGPNQAGALGGPAQQHRPAAPRGMRPQQRATAAPVNPVQRVEVRGRIAGISREGVLTVAAPNPYFRAPIQFTLAEDADIELEITGRAAASLIHKGDTVQASGVQVGPNAAQVRELTVELAEPLTNEKPDQAEGHRDRTPRRGPATRQRPRQGAEDDSQQDDDAAPATGETPSPATDTDSARDSEDDADASQEQPAERMGVQLPPLDDEADEESPDE